MVYGLGLRTSPRPDAIPLLKKSSVASSSLEELLKSSRKSEEHRNPIHHAHRRRQVEPYSIRQHHQRQRHHAHAPRSPSEPPTSSSNESNESSNEYPRSPAYHHRALPRTLQGRPRSNSAPSSSNTHLTSPFAHHKPLPSAEHYADRIKALRDGDGEWEPWSLNIVSPTVLPYVSLSVHLDNHCFDIKLTVTNSTRDHILTHEPRLLLYQQTSCAVHLFTILLPSASKLRCKLSPQRQHTSQSSFPVQRSITVPPASPLLTLATHPLSARVFLRPRRVPRS